MKLEGTMILYMRSFEILKHYLQHSFVLAESFRIG